jgi:hypothetical protein
VLPAAPPFSADPPHPACLLSSSRCCRSLPHPAQQLKGDAGEAASSALHAAKSCAARPACGLSHRCPPPVCGGLSRPGSTWGLAAARLTTQRQQQRCTLPAPRTPNPPSQPALAAAQLGGRPVRQGGGAVGGGHAPGLHPPAVHAPPYAARALSHHRCVTVLCCAVHPSKPPTLQLSTLLYCCIRCYPLQYCQHEFTLWCGVRQYRLNFAAKCSTAR